VFGGVADAWPDAVDIEGIVTGLMPSYCGFACRAGVLRVHVTKADTVVRGRDLFVATWCISVADSPKYCGHKVQFHAKKLYPSSARCGLEGDGFFDSKGMPYYAVTDAERDISIRATP
jgi:hypothetical protein